MGRPYTHPGTIIPVVMETPPRRPYVSPPPHPTNTTRPLPPLARCLFYHPPAPLLEPPFRESTRNSYRSADEFEVLRILRGVLLTTGSSLSLSLPLLFIFLFFPRFFTSLLLPPSVSTPPRGFSPFYPSSSSLFRKREESFPTLRVIRNRALLDLAASVFASTRLLHAFHLAILAKDETLLVERRVYELSFRSIGTLLRSIICSCIR